MRGQRRCWLHAGLSLSEVVGQPGHHTGRLAHQPAHGCGQLGTAGLKRLVGMTGFVIAHLGHHRT